MSASATKWICCQLGAREHYSIPRALQSRDALACLITDAWVRPCSLASVIHRRLRERFHPALDGAEVRGWNTGLLGFELRSRLARQSGWRRVMARNDWFQRRAVGALARHAATARAPATVFAYSYAAREIMRFARAQGWRTVLGQIDPGPPEERSVARLYRGDASQSARWQPAPPEYWASWVEECRLADAVVVNSRWSKDALAEEGVAAGKIHVVPLAFEPPLNAKEFTRTYPDAFTPARPLRVLFLGQVTLRKGMGPVLDAIRLLAGDPVEFWFVGPLQINVPDDLHASARVHWTGAVSRGETARYFRDADVFLFPTFSDGFGLTQLEAQAWKLPIIASRFCGDVVTDGVNGLLLDDVSAADIVSAVRRVSREPESLRAMTASSGVGQQFTLN
ncbi:MAG TPA: glycosyltransferase family 4 protein, partial [Verrucomicrobiae bacterium]